MAAASLRALLTRAIDYAGMFPPCSLELEPALKNQADYVRATDAWMLSTFVLSVAKFAGAASLLSGFDKHHPLRVSALGAKTENAGAFIAELKNAAEAIRSFQNQHGRPSDSPASGTSILGHQGHHDIQVVACLMPK